MTTTGEDPVLVKACRVEALLTEYFSTNAPFRDGTELGCALRELWEEVFLADRMNDHDTEPKAGVGGGVSLEEMP